MVSRSKLLITLSRFGASPFSRPYRESQLILADCQKPSLPEIVTSERDDFERLETVQPGKLVEGF